MDLIQIEHSKEMIHYRDKEKIMTTVTRLQVSQPLGSQPVATGQPETQVSFKGESDSFAKSKKLDVVAATAVGAAAGALGARTVNNKLDKYARHYDVDMNRELNVQEKAQFHAEIKNDAAKTEKNYKEDVKAARAYVKDHKAYLKSTKKSKEASKEIKKENIQVAKDLLVDAKAKFNELTKVPAKYRAVAAVAGAIVVGGAYAIAKALVGNKSSK
jgi:hypothetical protein